MTGSILWCQQELIAQAFSRDARTSRPGRRWGISPDLCMCTSYRAIMWLQETWHLSTTPEQYLPEVMCWVSQMFIGGGGLWNLPRNTHTHTHTRWRHRFIQLQRWKSHRPCISLLTNLTFGLLSKASVRYTACTTTPNFCSSPRVAIPPRPTLVPLQNGPTRQVSGYVD